MSATQPDEEAGPLITPGRAKELRRSAAHHAAMILITARRSGWDPEHYFPDEAERDLVFDEVDRIAEEIKLRAIVGTTQRCPECNFPYRVKADGTMHRHTGCSPSGFSTGRPCPGVGKPPVP
ncbi:hypothetical protein GCM10023084_02840 [Streptomyces lacrimifluminis]|uniref:hypothetical protein n=1 Tax=Streptomyces lacrimifluminis TaxID=1500077 RepID=UPI0031E5E6A8